MKKSKFKINFSLIIMILITFIININVKAEYDNITFDVLIKQPEFHLPTGATMDEDGIYVNEPNVVTGYLNSDFKNHSVEANININYNETVGAWFGIMMRASSVDRAPWEQSTAYSILLYEDKIELLKNNGSQVLTLLTTSSYQINSNQEMHIKFGTEDISSSSVRVFLEIKGITVLDYIDENNPIKTSGYLSFMGYLDVYYSIKKVNTEEGSIPMNEGSMSTIREIENLNYLNEYDKWAPNLESFYPQLSINDKEVTLKNYGAAGYKNLIDLKKISFDIQLNSNGEQDAYALFQFNKRDRESFFNPASYVSKLVNNYGYAVKVYPSGLVQLTKTTTGSSEKILLSITTNLDFMNSKQEITIYFNEIDSKTSELSIFINDATVGSKYIDEQYNTAYGPKGYIGIYNYGKLSSVTVSDIKIEGTEESPEPQAIDSVYLVDVFDENNKKIIHWEYNRSSTNLYGVEILDESNNRLAFINHHKKQYEVPSTYTGDNLLVVTVGIDGNKSEPISVDLNLDKSLYLEDNQERIIVKSDIDYAKFYKKESGENFIVRGTNYIKLRYDHSTFDADTEKTIGDYDPLTADSMLMEHKKNGYNTVRVFLIGRDTFNPGISGSYNTTQGLYEPYLDNFVDFLQRAQKYGIYVFPAFGDGEVPNNQYFLEKTDGVHNGNEIILTQKGIDAKKEFIVETLNYIKNVDPSLLKALLAVEFQNEAHLNANEWPFNMINGTVTLANGKLYDMENLDERQLAADEGRIYYMNQLVEAIKSVDSELLTSEGTFSLKAVQKDPVNDYGMVTKSTTDMRFPATVDVYLRSNIDFLDMHFYYTSGNTLQLNYKQDAISMNLYSDETKDLRKNKPIIMGEFGNFIYREDDFDQVKENIKLTRDLVLTDGFMGYIMWTFDTFNQSQLHNAMYQDGSLFRELSQDNISYPDIQKDETSSEDDEEEEPIENIENDEENNSKSPLIMRMIVGTTAIGIGILISLFTKNRKKY